MLEDEHFVGNVLATYDLGDMYKYGRGCEINSEIAQQYYNVALNHFEYLYENQETTQQREKHYKQGKKRKEKDEYDIRSYYAYRIGKQYYYGQGTEENYEKARNWFETSGTKYAKYNLGKMAYYGQGEEKILIRHLIILSVCQNRRVKKMKKTLMHMPVINQPV